MHWLEQGLQFYLLKNTLWASRDKIPLKVSAQINTFLSKASIEIRSAVALVLYGRKSILNQKGDYR